MERTRLQWYEPAWRFIEQRSWGSHGYAHQHAHAYAHGYPHRDPDVDSNVDADEHPDS